jgi:probable ribonuclease FAU-1
MLPRVKIRGIYCTALTKLALDSGLQIVDASQKIRERIHMESPDHGEYEVLIQDREDRQGIEVKGEADRVCEVLIHMQESLLDAIIVGFFPTDDSEPLVVANLELPGAAKEKLDRVRSSVVPTLKNHHRLKIINPDLLESAEMEFCRHPEDGIGLEKRLLREAILDPILKEGTVRLEHIRPSGKPMRPRLGVLQSVSENSVVFKREFSKGRYDGLDLPIRKGDFCLTQVREGQWYIKHSYFSKEHLRIGEYFNINTPTELYPYGARYVDLEVDVIQRAGETAFAMDQEKLEVLAQKGCIGKDLHNKVLLVSKQLLRSLNRGKAKNSPE